MSAEPSWILLVASGDNAWRLTLHLEQAGHRVRRVALASEALTVAPRASAIVLDGLPGDMALESFCRRLRDDSRTTTVPILLLTGYPSPLIPAGLDAFLYHPICPTQLLGQLELLARLRDAQAMYQSLVQTLPVAIYRKDASGRLLFVNRQLADHLHRHPDELLGRTTSEFAEEDLARRYLADGTGEDLLVDLTPEGEPRCFQRIRTPLVNPAGEVIGEQGMFWDVTARRQAEAAAVDHAIARRIHRKLFPAARSLLLGFVRNHGLELAGVSYPAEAVGGDCYDWFPLGWECMGVAVADVSGHGTGAALVMAETRAYLRASAGVSPEPGEVLARVNQLLVEDLEGDRYVTLLLARLDLTARSLVYASAGHATAYLFDEHGCIKEMLPSLDVPLGIHPQQGYQTSAPIHLAAGDLLLLLTDGVAEARDPQGQAFGQRRIHDVVRYYRRGTARQIAENLYHAVRAFSQNQPPNDDITAVVVKALPAS